MHERALRKTLLFFPKQNESSIFAVFFEVALYRKRKHGYRNEFSLHASLIQTLYEAIDQEKENLNQSSLYEIEGSSLVVTEHSENCKTTELCLQTSFLSKYQICTKRIPKQ